MGWVKSSDNVWDARINGQVCQIIKSGIKTKPVYDLFIDGEAVRRFPKLNEAKSWAGPWMTRSEQGVPKPPRALQGAAATARANAAQRAAEGNGKVKEAKSCLCGCGGQTKGGTFVTGHDARYKSALIREALAGNVEAQAEIERRGWQAHLEKSRSAAERRVVPDAIKAERAAKATVEEQTASERLTVLNGMKRAARLVRGTDDPRRGRVDRENYRDILREYGEK